MRHLLEKFMLKIQELNLEKSRPHTKKNHDYPKIHPKQPDFDTAFSARSSGAKYKHKYDTTTYLKDSPSSIRPINENHITLEQQKSQKLCLREISRQEKYINSKVLGNPYPNYIDQTFSEKQAKKIDVTSEINSYANEIIHKLPSMNSVLFPVYSMEMSYHLSNFLSCKDIDWEPFGYERKFEIQKIKGLVFFHLL